MGKGSTKFEDVQLPKYYKLKILELPHKLKIATTYTMKDKYYKDTRWYTRYKLTRYTMMPKCASLGNIQIEINHISQACPNSTYSIGLLFNGNH